MFFYYNKDKALNGISYCVYQSETKLTEEQIKDINKLQNNLLDNSIIYENDTYFIGYPIVENETIRPATEKELFDLGIIELEDGEKFEGDVLVKVPAPSWQYKWNGNEWVPDENKLRDGDYISENTIVHINAPADLILPKWNGSEWIENATELQKIEHQYNEYLLLNNPLDWNKMQTEDILNEYIQFMEQSRSAIFQSKKGRSSLFIVQEPSEKLKNYYNLVLSMSNKKNINTSYYNRGVM